MRVLIDHQAFDMQKFGGISRYFYELFVQFQQMNGIDFEISLRYSDNEYVKNLPQLSKKINKDDIFQQSFGGKNFLGKKTAFKFLNKNKIELPDYYKQNKENTIKKLKEGNFDIFHATYYDDYFLDHIGDKPYVITVYDLIHQIYPEFYFNDNKDKTTKMLNGAAGIIAISHSTKKDLMDFFDIAEEKIKVTYLANSLVKRKTPSQNFITSVPKNYLLFVGNRTGYKNFYFFAEAFAKIIQENPDLHLVCTGGKFSKEEELFFEKLQIKNLTKQFFVDDDELVYLYENAACFVFPSLYEGFGIPILEAFENKCCTLSANTSSLKEIGGEGALFFDSKDFKMLVQNLKNILSDKNLQQKLVSEGLKIRKNFSWQKTAAQTLEMYNKFL